jgi:glycosyltransferase involved in cell wall biosynthesis
MAQVRKNKVIVLASVLKPVDETRMYEKIAHTLAQELRHTIHIIGFPSSSQSAIPNVHFHPIRPKPFSRMSFSRLAAPWRYLRQLRKLGPDVIIFTTHELIVPSVLYRALYNCRLLYDVQENYFRNLWYNRTFPWGIRHGLALYVRLKEVLLSSFVDYFLLAEKSYAQELPFVKPYIVLQNKLPQYIAEQYPRVGPRDYSHFLFSGTLAESTGVFDAIELVKELRKHIPQAILTVAGFCSQHQCRERLLQETQHHDFIRLEMTATPLPHTRILEAIQAADIGLVLYPPNPSTRGSIPTKVYEYLALGLPMIIRHTTECHRLVRNLKGGITIDQNTDIQRIMAELKSTGSVELKPDIFWEYDSTTLKSVINA